MPIRVLYTNIDRTLVNIFTQTVELRNWSIKLSLLLQQSIEHVSIVNTCNTYFVMHWYM